MVSDWEMLKPMRVRVKFSGTPSAVAVNEYDSESVMTPDWVGVMVKTPDE